MHLWGQKHQTTTPKAITQQHNFESLFSMFANQHVCVVLRSSVHHIDGWILFQTHALIQIYLNPSYIFYDKIKL